MEEIVQYILHFMLGERIPDEICKLVGYTSDTESFSKYKVVIVPSGFFDDGVYLTEKTIPSLPLKYIENVPFLYGKPVVENIGGTFVVYADLVASAFFLLSRYEEVLYRKKRDAYGRFPGVESLPYRAGFIDSPIVDKYGCLLRKWLKDNGVEMQDELLPYISRVNLTHDVDAPFDCRTWRNVARKILSGSNPFSAVRAKFSALEQDKFYTFPEIFEENKLLHDIIGTKRYRITLFFKAGGDTKQDKPNYDLRGRDIQALFSLCKKNNVSVGLHCSYKSSIDTSLIASEKKNLEEAFGLSVTKSRNHFLASREPEDMSALESAGISDDYTLGYADIAGFRIGTALPVRFINPVSKRLSSLVLHPLTIMDCTLNDAKYMNFTKEAAIKYCETLMQNAGSVNGELTLLWHNTSFVEPDCGYLRELYSELLHKLK